MRCSCGVDNVARHVRGLAGPASDRKTSWIDVCWTLGTGLTGVFLAIVQDGLRGIPSGRQILVAAIAALWSGRLGWYLMSCARGIGDDPRYRAMIAAWGQDAQAKLFWHLQIQACVGLLLASCIVVAARNPSPLVRVQDLAAIALVLISVTGEALADDQMRRFRRSSGHGRNICDAGLWQWSRHPNYFFEWLFWLALPLLAVGYAVGWVAILAPLCMYWLLVHVSEFRRSRHIWPAAGGRRSRNIAGAPAPFCPFRQDGPVRRQIVLSARRTERPPEPQAQFPSLCPLRREAKTSCAGLPDC